MELIMAVAAGMAVALGLLVMIAGWRGAVWRREPSPRRGTLGERWGRLSPVQRWQLAAGLVAGVLTYALTGWVVMLALVPAAAVGLPVLLGAPANRDIVLLEALDRWVRSLASTIPTGKSIVDAIRVSRRNAPAQLAEGIELIVARLDDRWTTREALLAFADDLDSPDADAVVAALILAAHRGGTGATATLDALSESIQDRLKAMREIEAERAKPRVVVRQVTLITLVVLAAALLLGGSYFSPYRSPVGQVLLAVLMAMYVGSLVMLRRMTRPRSRERILQRAGSS